MQDRVVAVLGAGNMRCATLVMGSFAVWAPDDLVEIRLFDANEERLDLVDRFLREAMEIAKSEHVVKATSEVTEALDGTTDLVLTLHEDCVRRMRGRVSPELYSPEEPSRLVDQVRGDPNKPTPPDRLSEQTQTYLSVPSATEESREELLVSVSNEALAMGQGARALNLIRGVHLGQRSRLTELEWPSELTRNELQMVPHQILRWLQGDHSLQAVLDGCRFSPLVAWLDGHD